MNQKNYLQVTGLIFLVVALVHLYRSFAGFPVEMGGLEIPAWVSYAGTVVAGYLSYSAYKLMK